jgi:predicted transposase/invertase (TIGR01784 family)
MGIGICPTVDFAFKLMLGSPEHTNVTKHFLNSILEGQGRISHVRILNPILDKDNIDDKLAVLDVLATDEHGRKLNIEMQTSLPGELPQRLVYYAACLYAGQLTSGASYSTLRPAISICVLKQVMFPQSSRLHLDFRLREVSGELLTDDLQIHLLQLPKLRVTAQNVYHASPTERWAYFLGNAEYLTHEDIRRLFPDEEIVEAAGVLKMISQTPENRYLYEARLKAQRDEESRMRKALQDGFEKGREEGREAGREEGRQEGREEGREEGRSEGLQDGVRAGRILLLQQILGLPESTLEQLAACDSAWLSDLEEKLQQQLRLRHQS